MCACPVLFTGKVWFTQKIPVMVPAEGTCVRELHNMLGYKYYAYIYVCMCGCTEIIDFIFLY